MPTVRTVTAVPAYSAGSSYILQDTAATYAATSTPSKQGFAAHPTGTQRGIIAAIVITVVLVIAIVFSPFLLKACLRRKRLKQAQREQKDHRMSTLQRVNREDHGGEDTPELSTNAPVPRELPAQHSPGLAFHLSHEVKDPSPTQEPIELDAAPIPAFQRAVSPTATLKADLNPLRPSYDHANSARPSQYDGSSPIAFTPESASLPSPQPQRSSSLQSLRRRLSLLNPRSRSRHRSESADGFEQPSQDMRRRDAVCGGIGEQYHEYCDPKSVDGQAPKDPTERHTGNVRHLKGLPEGDEVSEHDS